MNKLEETIRSLEQLGCQPKSTGVDKYQSFCPIHETDGGHNPSLSISAGHNDNVLIYCHAGCDTNLIFQQIKSMTPSHPQKNIVAIYKYYDEKNHLLFEKIRYDPKDFRIRYTDRFGEVIWKLPTTKPPLYNLPTVLNAIKNKETVYIVEGEKDVDNLGKHKLIATCNFDGAAKEGQNPKWRDRYNETLKEADSIVIISDNDDPGRAHAQFIIEALSKYVKNIKIVELPGLKDKEDVSDYLINHTIQDLLAIIADTPIYNGKKELIVLDKQSSDAINQNGLPEILILDGDLPGIIDSIEKHLIQSNSLIFQRSGGLYRINYENSFDITTSSTIKQCTLVPVHEHWLITECERYINFKKIDNRKKKKVPTNCPDQIARRILHNTARWKFPTLNTIISAPTIRLDGTILEKYGYDIETALFYDKQNDYPALPRFVSKQDGIDALTFIKKELLENDCVTSKEKGFVFSSNASKASALAAILTSVIRPVLPTAPLFLINASRAGSGKSLLADIISIIGSGKLPKTLEWNEDNIELEKTIISILAAGVSVVNIDNITTPLGGRILDKILTSKEYTGRLLGANKLITCSTNILWLATGNNTTVIADTTRRVILCTLDPQTDKPENRIYTKNLYKYVYENRIKIVMAVITAIKSYYDAKLPNQHIKQMGSFEEWSNIIRNVLLFLNESDCLENTTSLEKNDPERKKIIDFMTGWDEIYGDGMGAVKELVALSKSVIANDDDRYGETYRYPGLRSVLEEYFADRHGEINKQKIGVFLSKYENRIENNRKFIKIEHKHGVSIWRLVKI